MAGWIRWTLGTLALVACLQAQALELMTEDDPPNNMLRDGKLAGMSTDKLSEAFRRAGVPQHMELVPWARAYQSALTQPGFCAFSAARTPEREGLFKWVGPVAQTDWVLYAPADSKLPRPAKLEEVKKQVLGGYLQDVISVWLLDHGYRVDTATSDAANPRKLLAGHIDYWASAGPRATALLAKEKLGGRIVPVLTFGHTDLYLACNKATSDDVVKKLNQALRAMNEDGTSGRIEMRYAHWMDE
jgi:polar amino acid transport system substrate-binding protein